MSSKTSDAIGVALLSISGGMIVGKIISQLTEDEGPPGRPSTSTRKKKDDKTIGFISKSKKYIVEIQPPSQEKGSRSETLSPAVEKKYPDNYYYLSKSQQYKYRKRLAEELYDISQK